MALTLVVGTEASVAVVAVGHKVEAEPIFVADDGRWDIAARQPDRERERQRQWDFHKTSKKSKREIKK